MMIFSFLATDTLDCTAIHLKLKPCDSLQWWISCKNHQLFSLYTYNIPIESKFYRLNQYIYEIAISAKAKTVAWHISHPFDPQSSQFQIRSYDLRDDFGRNKTNDIRNTHIEYKIGKQISDLKSSFVFFCRINNENEAHIGAESILPQSYYFFSQFVSLSHIFTLYLCSLFFSISKRQGLLLFRSHCLN